jgi:ssDNA-binding replication factor A large subunit
MNVKISDLKIGSTGVDLVADVEEVGEPFPVKTKYGYRTTVTKVTLKDETGSIVLTVWGDKFNEINEGDKVEIKSGFVTEFKGVLQLNIPKAGEINVLKE